MNGYINEVRNLLHDLTNSFWDNTQIAAYVNEGRRQVCWHTKCYRFLQNFTTIQGVEVYSFSQLPRNIAGDQTVDILNITLIYGSQRIPLNNMAWTGFSAYYRPWTTYQSQPITWAQYGQDQFYLGPNPDQAYALEVDTAVVPPDLTLTNGDDPDVILDPYTSAVKYYAAYRAKQYQQQTNDAEQYLRDYQKEIGRIMMGVSARRIFSPYQARY